MMKSVSVSMRFGMRNTEQYILPHSKERRTAFQGLGSSKLQFLRLLTAIGNRRFVIKDEWDQARLPPESPISGGGE